jgi:hypothetical protein
MLRTLLALKEIHKPASGESSSAPDRRRAESHGERQSEAIISGHPQRLKATVTLWHRGGVLAGGPFGAARRFGRWGS